jgi:antitoxin PrlF
MSIFGKITSKGQTTVPLEIRNVLGIKPGEHLEYVIGDGGQITLRKASTLESLRGIIKVDHPVDWNEVDRMVAERRGRG